MIEDILRNTGLLYHQGSSPAHLPPETFVCWFDNILLDGPDRVLLSGENSIPCIYRHDIRLEVYEPQEDPTAEMAIESQIIAKGLSFSKYDREWLRSVQRYLVTYELSYMTKSTRRN